MYEEESSACFDRPDQGEVAAHEAATMADISNTFSSQTDIDPNTIIASFPPPPPPLSPLMAAASAPNSLNNSFEENLTLSMEELSYHYNYNNNNNNNYNNNNNNDDHILSHHHHELENHHQPMGMEFHNDQTNWVDPTDTHHLYHNQDAYNQMQEMDDFHHNNLHLHQEQQEMQQQFSESMAYPPAPDLLNLFNLPRSCSTPSSLLPNPSISLSNPFYHDPLLHLNLPPQPPLFKELFQSLPHGYGLSAAANSSRGGGKGGTLFGDQENHEREGSGGHVYEDGDIGNGVLEFTREIADCMGKRRRNRKVTKHFTTERQRRVQLKDKYEVLKSLVPSPSKSDRASIVGDAIGHIKELLRTVEELKLQVQEKRCSRERRKWKKGDQNNHDQDQPSLDAVGEDQSLDVKPNGGDPDHHHSYNLRSSWLQRKSKDTEVDVRIIDDEVTIKLVQRKINCLLLVSKVLDDLHLDLHHVAGGHIGDYYSFLFNTKIYEGTSVYASAIANKLIEVVDKQHSSSTPPASAAY